MFRMQEGIPGFGGTVKKGLGYLDAAGQQLADLMGSKNASKMGGPNTSRPLTQIKDAGIDPGSHSGPAAPSAEDRAYIEEVSRLTQQADPYMTAAMGVQPNVGAAFGKPMPKRDYADEKDGLMGILNQMEEENLKNMGYGPAPAMVNLGQSTAGGAAAANMTQAAETAEAAGNLQPQVPLSPNYTGFPGKQPVTQGFADGLSLDMADGILAELEQSRNNPNRDFRGNSPILGL